jgi:hypothetical protein
MLKLVSPRLRRLALAVTVAALAAEAPVPAAMAARDPLCTGAYGGAAPREGAPLRFGIDPGLAGSAGGIQLPATPDDPQRDLSAVEALRPSGHVLVVRLNRLFFSDGQAGIDRFRGLVGMYVRAGFDVELQVRYHPSQAENGNLAAWVAYVRHVVDTFGANRHVLDMTITNEVNLDVSPNTSDGSYKDARDALIDGIEAAHAEALRRHFRGLRFGFTYAYRWDPQSDAAFFAYLGDRGGARFRRSLGFVGLDFYPGSFYPPAMIATTYGSATAEALGTLRDCYLPMAQVGPRTPLWITENGVPTGLDESQAEQASALTQLVQAVRDYSGTYGVTDYRWFNLRDSSETPLGSLPGAALTFATDGLMTDTYLPKPAFAAYRQLIARYGARPARRGGSR